MEMVLILNMIPIAITLKNLMPAHSCHVSCLYVVSEITNNINSKHPSPNFCVSRVPAK